MEDLMSIYNGSVMVISLLIFVLTIVATKSSRSGGARAFILTAALMAYTALFIGPLQLLSYAKPITLEWINTDVPDAEVLHAELRENDGIYLLLDWYGVPRYYKLAWDVELAQQLIEAMEEANNGEQRPGQLRPTEASNEYQDYEQDMIDNMLGPQGDNEGDGTQLDAPQHMTKRGAMQNPGTGRVMMRRPFQNESEVENGGPSAAYGYSPSEAQFYAVPQEAYPEKEAPTER